MLLFLHVLPSPAAAECWETKAAMLAMPNCKAADISSKGSNYADSAGFVCSDNKCASSTCKLSEAFCSSCFVYYPNAVVNAPSGSCCTPDARTIRGSGGNHSTVSCAEQVASHADVVVRMAAGAHDNFTDDDIFEPDELEKFLEFADFGAWASFLAAGSLLAVQLRWMPEMRRQMRPRMLLVLLALDTLSAFFLGLKDAPAVYLSAKYHNHNDSSNLDRIFGYFG